MYARRVLVIEDEASSREALESLLVEEGYLVRTAPSGQAGLDCIDEFLPDVVVCDYYLPDLDGLQVLRQMRAGANAAASFIVMTAGLSGAVDGPALRAEADAFLAKPLDLAELNRALQAVRPRHHGRRIRESPL